MKKSLAILFLCMMLMMVAAPMTALAVEDDTFVGSVEQEIPIDENPVPGAEAPSDNVPAPGAKAPQTGEAFPVVPVAGAIFFAAAAVGLFAVAAKKQKN